MSLVAKVGDNIERLDQNSLFRRILSLLHLSSLTSSLSLNGGNNDIAGGGGEDKDEDEVCLSSVSFVATVGSKTEKFDPNSPSRPTPPLFHSSSLTTSLSFKGGDQDIAEEESEDEDEDGDKDEEIQSVSLVYQVGDIIVQSNPNSLSQRTPSLFHLSSLTSSHSLGGGDGGIAKADDEDHVEDEDEDGNVDGDESCLLPRGLLCDSLSSCTTRRLRNSS